MHNKNPLFFLFSIVLFAVITSSSNAQLPKLILPIGHTEYIRTLKITPDQKRVVTIGMDKKNILWDLETGFRLTDLYNDNKAIDDIVFNSTNTRILAVQKYETESTIPLWNATNGNLITKLNHAGKIYAQEFSPDGSVIVTAGLDKLIKIWDSETGNIIDSILNEDLIFRIKFSSDGKKIISGGGRSVKIYDYNQRKILLELSGHDDIISSISFSPDLKKILTSSYDQTVKVYDAENGNILHDIKLPEKVTTAFYNIDGDFFITESSDISNKTFKLWNARTGKLAQTLADAKDKPRFAVFSNDGNLIVSGSEQNDVKVWETKTGKLLYTLKDHFGGARKVQFTNNDSNLIVACSSSIVKIWDLKTGALVESIKLPYSGAMDIALDKNNSKLVIPSGNIALVYDLNTYTILAELKAQGMEAVQKISFTADQKTMITANNTESFKRLWDISTGDMLNGAIYAQGNIEQIMYSNSHKLAIVKYKDYKTIEIWNAQKGSLISTLYKDKSSYQNRWIFSIDETKLITSSSSDNKITIWDISTGNVIKTIEVKSQTSFNHLIITPDNKKIILIDIESNALVFDIETGNELFKINKMNDRAFHNYHFIGYKNWLLTSSNKESKIWDLENGQLIMELKSLSNAIQSFFLSPDQKTLITQSFNDAAIMLWDLEKKKLLFNLRGKEIVGNVRVSNDWKFAVTSSYFEQDVRIWDIKSGQLITAIKPHEISTNGIVLSTDSKYFFTYGGDKSIKKWELPNGRLIQSYDGITTYIKTLAYNNVKKQILAGSSSGDIKLWDAENGKLISSFSGHTGGINTAIFGLKENTIISASDDQTLKVWNSNNGKLINTFFPVGEADFLNQINYGYYKSSPGASKLLHYVTTDLQPITFDQLDLKYNRPDKVLKEIGFIDTILTNAYYKAYLKRIAKLGIDTSAFTNGFNLPVVDITNRKSITFDQKENLLQLHIKGNDANLLLDRYNVWVNENPIFGIKGISLNAKKTKNIDTTIIIKLSDGNNKIETSATNINGNESYRTPLYVNYKPTIASTQRFYFIGIGINEFEQKQHNLSWSVKDIQDLANAFKKKHAENAIIYTLLNDEVTLKNVMALKEKLKACNINDKVTIAYSGHGLLDKNFDYYLSTHDINFDKPQDEGIPYDAFENLVADIPARKKLILIDACHSGEIDKEELLKINNAAQNLQSGQILGGKGITVVNTAKKDGMKTSLELMQQLFAYVGRSSGATVISAAAGTQFALEKNDLQNGVFSYSILEYMKAKNKTTINDLKKYVNKRVVELTAGLQVPTTRTETNAINWEIW